MTRILVCGSRDFSDQQLFNNVFAYLPAEYCPITAIIEGGAKGADQMAHFFAQGLIAEGWDGQYLQFKAEWDKYGRSAGPRRNARMLSEGKPDIVLAFYSTPESKGTANMVRQATTAGIPVHKFGNFTTEEHS